MADFHIRQALQKFARQNNLGQPKLNPQHVQDVGQNASQQSSKSLVNQMQANIIKDIQQQMLTPQNLRMNHLASVDRAAYIKNLLKLPENMVDLMVLYASNKAQGKNPAEEMQQNQQMKNLQQQLTQNAIQNPSKNPAQLQQQVNQFQNQQPLPQQNQQNMPNVPNQAQPQAQPQVQPQVQPPVVPQLEMQNNGSNKTQQNQQKQQQNQNQQQLQQDNAPKQPIKTGSDQFQQTMNTIHQNINNQIRKNIMDSLQRPMENRPSLENKPAQGGLNGTPTGGAANIGNKPNIEKPVLGRPNGTPTGGAANIEDTLKPHNHINNNPQVNNFAKHNPTQFQAKMHNQMVNTHRFQPMNDMRDNVRAHLRRPINNMPRVPVENLQNQVSKEIAQIENQAVQNAVQKQVSARIIPELVDLNSINTLIQKHSKMAMNNLILEMSTVSRQGMTDTKPLQDTISLIGSSISASSQNDTATAVKNLMLLYLPWLPLEEGVGFKLDVETKESVDGSDDTSISVFINTKNYGNLSAVINLITTNSVDVYIKCDKTFPKDLLLSRLNKDSSQHSMTTSIGVEQVSQTDTLAPEIQKAKVNLSNVTTINPYLLLIAHAFIRHSIEIDINTTMFGKASGDAI